MALEAPAVVSDIAATREVVDESCARFAPPNDPLRLSEAVVDALLHPKRAKVRAAAARHRFIENFTIDRAADGMVEFYRRALEGS
jgi:glycosyltransferase involved in cell wall biosynthesis